MILTFCQATAARDILLRIVSQTPVHGTEEARKLMFDHYGMLWVGTDQGLRSFDGHDFLTYRSDAYSPGILPNNYVGSMTEAPNDLLWLGTHDGLACFNRRKGSFKSYHLQGQNARTIDALFTSSDGTVWAGTANGVSRYDADKDDFVDINMPVGVRSFSEDKKGNIYIGTWEGGLFRLDHQSGKLVSYPKLSERNTVQSQLMDSRGRLWIGTWENGIIRLDHPENEADPGIHRINEGRRDFRTFHQLVVDSVSHAVWGCCIEGLTSVDLDDEHIVENHSELNFCYGIDSDGHGNLWVLTRNQGIVHLSTKPSPFRNYHFNTVGLELPVNRIQSVYTSNGNHFWLGLQPYGLAFYDRASNRVLYNSDIPGFAFMSATDPVHLHTISAFHQLHDGSLWIASTKGILVWQTGEPVRLLSRNKTPFIGDGDVNTLCQLHDGTMIVGQSVGMGVAFSETEGRLLISDIDVRHIIEDHDHRIWVATDNAGIICVTGDIRQPQTIKSRQYAPLNRNYPLKDAMAVYEDPFHRLWAISNSGAFFSYDAEKDCFEPINHRFHIDTGSLYAIEGDTKGHVWLSTDKGLVRIQCTNEQKGITAHYGVEDGLEDIHFSANGSFNYDGELFFGSANGFFSFRPEQLASWHQAEPPYLAVCELMIDDIPYARLDSVLKMKVSEEQPFFTRKITIPSDVRKFSVGFSLLAYHNQEQCKYSFCLNGYDHDWHYTHADNRRATYQNLPPGSYELRLRAIDSYGRQVVMPYTIQIQVLPPWYRTWWAYLIYFCMLMILIYGVKEWYKNRLKHRARLQERVSELLHYRELMVMRQFEGARKALEAEEQQHSSPDELFLQKAIDCVKQHLNDADYDREQFASDMCVSSSTLYNKLRTLTGQNVTGFINSIRLKEACRILRQRPDIKMTELSMEVGFNTPKYFTKCFKKEFGILPSEYLSQEI